MPTQASQKFKELKDLLQESNKKNKYPKRKNHKKSR